MIQTFLFSPDDQTDEMITIGGSEAHHMVSVLRLRKGEMVRLIDGRGTAHVCELIAAGGRKADCRIIKTTRNSGEAALDLTLAIGLSTGFKFDEIIEKGTEVGVRRFVPLVTEKGKVNLGGEAEIKRKLGRWRRIGEAAVKQAGRSIVPPIEEPIWFERFVSGCDPAASVLFHPQERLDDPLALVRQFANGAATVLVGPESGFSAAELDTARRSGIPTISLGERVMRTETAGVVLAALVIYLYATVKG
jgi:16S rRNA (uracil1498-N3)-methyltransferase